MHNKKRLVILGAGPIGVEAAIHAALRGYDVHIYERGPRVGMHVRSWGHVTFFSPWSLNRSAAGVALLHELGVTLPDDVDYPTGSEYVAQYLEPLSRHELLRGRVHTASEVLGVSRMNMLKGHCIGDPERARAPFVLLIRSAGEERYECADLVIDTTGTYAQHNELGPGGLPVPGASLLTPAQVTYDVPDVCGIARARYEGQRVLVVGAGFSAVTSLVLLHELKQRSHTTQISWLTWQEGQPYEEIAQDVLPQRAKLIAFGNDVAAHKVDGISWLKGSWIELIEPGVEGIQITVRSGGHVQRIVVDQIIANVGYKPNVDLYRELQVHQCYASEGPMKLAAALLAQSGGGGDCLTQASAGVETLMNPEPHFFILGSKSYGRGSAFLIRLGLEQIEELFEYLDGG